MLHFLSLTTIKATTRAVYLRKQHELLLNCSALGRKGTTSKAE